MARVPSAARRARARRSSRAWASAREIARPATPPIAAPHPRRRRGACLGEGRGGASRGVAKLDGEGHRRAKARVVRSRVARGEREERRLAIARARRRSAPSGSTRVARGHRRRDLELRALRAGRRGLREPSKRRAFRARTRSSTAQASRRGRVVADDRPTHARARAAVVRGASRERELRGVRPVEIRSPARRRKITRAAFAAAAANRAATVRATRAPDARVLCAAASCDGAVHRPRRPKR